MPDQGHYQRTLVITRTTMYNFRPMKTIFLCILSFLLLLSCSKDKPHDPFEACKANTSDTSFLIQELVGIADSVRYFSTDTIFASRELTYFTAVDTTADEYTWQFGSDQRTFSGQTVTLKFTEPYGAIRVRLVQKRNPANPCYGKLPSEVRYVKELFLVEPAKAPIMGVFYGYNQSGPTRKFTVSVLINGVTNIPFPTGKDYNFHNEVGYGSTAFYLGGRGTYDPEFGAYGTSGFGFLKEGNRVLQIDYSYRKPLANGSVEVVRDTFTGVKQ